MALTGEIETEDKALHPNAYGMAMPLAIVTYPNARADFKFNAWHDLQAMLDGRPQIYGFPVEFYVVGNELLQFIGAAEAMIVSGQANIVAAQVAQMQAVIKADQRFSTWTETA